jgi:hypothetical protein
MWMLMILFVALGLGLSRLSERAARLAIVPVILAMVGYQGLKYGLF